jgi:hypothetical protein
MRKAPSATVASAMQSLDADREDPGVERKELEILCGVPRDP